MEVQRINKLFGHQKILHKELLVNKDRNVNVFQSPKKTVGNGFVAANFQKERHEIILQSY